MIYFIMIALASFALNLIQYVAYRETIWLLRQYQSAWAEKELWKL